jgi:hypothetical protein
MESASERRNFHREGFRVRRDGKLRYPRHWLPRALGAAALAAGLLTAGWPAGPALASPAAAGRTSYSFTASATVRALGRTWSLDLSVTKGSGIDGIVAGLDTASKGVIESHEWGSGGAFAPTAAKDFTVAGSGHATVRTGGALSPVLTATLTFTPTRHTREACAKGSGTTYFGKLTGTLSLTTGLRGVKVGATFNGKAAGASLVVSDSCAPPTTPPSKIPCTGGFWSVSAVPLSTGSVAAIQARPTSPAWSESFIRGTVRTASKWLTRTDDLFVPGGPAPRLNKKTRTVAVTGTGPITGAAVVTYGSTFTPSPAPSCYLGGKRYAEKTVLYTGTSVAVSRPFEAHTVLTGTQTMATGPYAQYAAVSLTAS